MDLQELSNLATAIGAPVAIAALFYTGWQLRRTRLIEQGRFMLELERMSEKHDPIHTRLRRSGDWHGSAGGPKTLQEWVAVDDYMGFFEHCELLLKAGTLKTQAFKSLYGYRVENIAANPVLVRAKLIQEKEYWLEFLDLCKRLKIEPVETAG